jgi:hypothetical protein
MLTRLNPLKILALAVFVVIALFLWEGNKGFSLADEGYLWYGVQRVMLGEVPVRDFMAYDPGRYYYSAALMSLMSDNGILALRFVTAIFSALGLFAGLFLIARAQNRSNIAYLILSAITLVVWMLPRHKLFDISLSIWIIGALAFLIQNPTRIRYFIAGLCVGLVAVFGRNHGFYGVIGSVGVILWLGIQREEGPRRTEAFLLWGVGVGLGFLPIIFMALFVPDFGNAFLGSIRLLFESRTTNFSLPVPWPWQVDFFALPLSEAMRNVVIGLFFIAPLVFGVLSIIWVVRRRFQQKQVSPEFAAASFLTLPYAHFAFSRADVSHLAQSLFPLLIGCLIYLSIKPAKVKWSLATALCAASLWLMHSYHPGWQCYVNSCVNIKISGSNLLVDPATASDVALLRKLASQYAPNGQSIIATPFWPGAYALLERKSPLWTIYHPLTPPSQALQQAEIGRIKMERPGFVLVIDLALDGRDELRFRNTSPEIYRYIEDNFERITVSPNPAYQFFRARENSQNTLM